MSDMTVCQSDTGEITSGLVTKSWTTRRVMKLQSGDRWGDDGVCETEIIIMSQRGDHKTREKQRGLLHCGKSIWGDGEQRRLLSEGKQKTGQSGQKIKKKETSQCEIDFLINCKKTFFHFLRLKSILRSEVSSSLTERRRTLSGLRRRNWTTFCQSPQQFWWRNCLLGGERGSASQISVLWVIPGILSKFLTTRKLTRILWR